MAGPTLSRFTPSVMAYDLLERLFVARERTLDAVMQRIDAASASDDERNHTLLVGPRGAGKTHLVSLVAHRTRERMGAGARVHLAWLPEDPWTLVSYRHLLAEIVARLEPALDGEAPRSAPDLELLLARRAAEHGPAVVIVENLDQIWAALGDDGQQSLRHLLQGDRSLLLVGTTTTLDRALSDQAKPFYAFFSTTRLEPFDVDEAAEMLTAIAREREDEALVEYLASDEGRARLRTIEHLAGGQPRMWAALASALTVEGLDDLVDLLLTRFDDLTPYYQEQLGKLAPRQRLVVSEMAEADRPLTVKDLAERLDVDQRSLGKTMSELVERRWVAEIDSPVTALLDRRRTYYELAEPMARLSFQIKDNRGEPLRLIVDFLKHWFDPDDFVGLVSAEEPAKANEQLSRYLAAAERAQSAEPVLDAVRRLSGLPPSSGEGAPDVLGAADDALAALAGNDPDPFLALPVSIRRVLEARLEADATTAVRAAVHEAALDCGLIHRALSANRWVTRAEDLVATAEGRATEARCCLVRWLARAARLEEAMTALRSLQADVGDADDASVEWALAGQDLSNWLVILGRITEGAALYDETRSAVGRWPSDLPRVGDLLAALAQRHSEMVQLAASIKRAVESDPERFSAFVRAELPDSYTLGVAAVYELRRVGRVRQADALLGRVVNAALDAWGDGDVRAVEAARLRREWGGLR